MNMTLCPIECVDSACPPADFLEKHSTFVITITGALSGLLGVIFTYFLKSRCTKVSCCCASCEREPIPVDAENIEVINNNVS